MTQTNNYKSERTVNEPKDRTGRLALAERDGAARLKERQAKKPNRDYAFAAGVKRAGDNKYLDRPDAPLAAKESNLGFGSNSIGVDTSVTSRNTVRKGKYGVAD